MNLSCPFTGCVTRSPDATGASLHGDHAPFGGRCVSRSREPWHGARPGLPVPPHRSPAENGQRERQGRKPRRREGAGEGRPLISARFPLCPESVRKLSQEADEDRRQLRGWRVETRSGSRSSDSEQRGPSSVPCVPGDHPGKAPPPAPAPARESHRRATAGWARGEVAVDGRTVPAGWGGRGGTPAAERLAPWDPEDREGRMSGRRRGGELRSWKGALEQEWAAGEPAAGPSRGVLGTLLQREGRTRTDRGGGAWARSREQLPGRWRRGGGPAPSHTGCQEKLAVWCRSASRCGRGSGEGVFLPAFTAI